MAELGLVGTGVMGSALALNLAEKGHHVSLLDRDIGKARQVVDEGAGMGGHLRACDDVQAFLATLTPPRAVLVMVPSGKPLATVVADLLPHLDKGDLIVDLGNSNFRDTRDQVAACEAHGIHYLGVGVSGGAQGARNGPSIMAGGSRAAWALVEGPLKDAAARYRGQPCCDWFGPGGAGHFIKMVHNGIEYAVMQLIAEVYGVLRDGAGMDARAIGDVFAGWKTGPLDCYLVEIAAEVSRADDPATGRAMLDMIRDSAGQKGTGRWSVIEGLHLGAPVSLIAAAVEARNLSADAIMRGAAATRYGQPLRKGAAPKLETLRQALVVGKVCAYAQGFELLRRAGAEFDWGLDLSAIAKVWRAGCIIRSDLLDDMAGAFCGGADHLLTAEPFAGLVAEGTASLRDVLARAASCGVDTPVLAATLSYHTALRKSRGTANMIQALRDRFGEHGFERVDAPGEQAHGPWGHD